MQYVDKGPVLSKYIIGIKYIHRGNIEVTNDMCVPIQLKPLIYTEKTSLTDVSLDVSGHRCI